MHARAIDIGHIPCAAIAIGHSAACQVSGRPRPLLPGQAGVRVPARVCGIIISLWLSYLVLVRILVQDQDLVVLVLDI